MKYIVRCAAVMAGCGLAAVPPSASAGGASGGTPVVPSAPVANLSAPAAPDNAVLHTKTVKLTRPQTKSVQRRVKVRADGRLGARTQTAIKRYQRTKSLVTTGRPNLETLRAMELKFAEGIARKLLEDQSAAPAAAASEVSTQAIRAALGQSGTPYAWGGAAPGGFDCSGLTQWAYGQAGVKLPHSSFEQYKLGRAVERSAIEPGDLVFFDSAGPGASDVGIATSATTVVSATSSRGVLDHATFDEYWGSHYVGARRIAAGT